MLLPALCHMQSYDEKKEINITRFISEVAHKYGLSATPKVQFILTDESVDGRYYCCHSRGLQESLDSLSQSEARSNGLGCCCRGMLLLRVVFC